MTMGKVRMTEEGLANDPAIWFSSIPKGGEYMNNRILMIAVVVLVIIGAGAFLLTKNSTSTMPAANPTPTQAMMKAVETTTPTASPSEAMKVSGTPSPSDAMKATTGSVKELTVSGSNFKFAPATLSVKKGDTVKLTFTSSGGMHDLVIDEYNVKTKVIPSGQSETVTFVADKAGKFDYYCSVSNHRAMGMQGTLTVQ